MSRVEIVESLAELQAGLDNLQITNDTSDELPSLAQVSQDVVSLSRFLSNESTNLALALRPPVSAQAAQSCISKIRDHHRKLAYLQQTVLSRQQSSKWRNELERAIKDVSDSIKQCAPLWKKSAAASTSTSDRKLLLQRTARVWESVQHNLDLSKSEREAHVKVWKEQLVMLNDALDQARDDEQVDAVSWIQTTIDMVERIIANNESKDDDRRLSGLTDAIEKTSAAADDLLDEEPDAKEHLEKVLRQIVSNLTPDSELERHCIDALSTLSK